MSGKLCTFCFQLAEHSLSDSGYLEDIAHCSPAGDYQRSSVSSESIFVAKAGGVRVILDLIVFLHDAVGFGLFVEDHHVIRHDKKRTFEAYHKRAASPFLYGPHAMVTRIHYYSSGKENLQYLREARGSRQAYLST